MPIVLLHGHGVDASVWDRVYAHLSDDGSESPQHVWKHDLSQLATHETIDDYAEIVAKYIRAETDIDAGGKAVVVGHSMGGYIALALAERHPDLVGGLVLYHSTAYADDEAKKEQRTKAIGALTEGGAPKYIHELMPKMVAPDYPVDLVQALEERFRALPTDALVAGMKAIATRPDRTHVLRNATYPVLVVLGREDQIIPYEQGQAMGELGENVEVVILEDVGHLSMVEDPDASVETLRSFMARF